MQMGEDSFDKNFLIINNKNMELSRADLVMKIHSLKSFMISSRTIT